MDVGFGARLALAALVGCGCAAPLADLGDRLLAAVRPEDAAPRTLPERAEAVPLVQTTGGMTASLATGGTTTPLTVGDTTASLATGGTTEPLTVGDTTASLATGDTTEPLTVARLSRGWRLALLVALGVAAPVALARAELGPRGWLPVPLAALALFACLATLALVAVLDGAAHLVFVEVLAPLVIVIFGLGLVGAPGAWLGMLAGGVGAGALFLGLFALGHWLYGAEALGFGDVQLAAAFGALLGWRLILGALLLGLVALVAVALPLVVGGRLSGRTLLPLGAFLALGAAVTLVSAMPPWW